MRTDRIQKEFIYNCFPFLFQPICSSDKSCYTHPANCKFEDCDFILSVSKLLYKNWNTCLLIDWRALHWNIFKKCRLGRILHSSDWKICEFPESLSNCSRITLQGLLDDRIFTCFGKNAYCWLGVDRNIPDVPYTLDPKHRVLSDLTVISAADKEYVNEMPEGVIPYTPKLKYFFRTGTAGGKILKLSSSNSEILISVYTNPIIRTELHHVTDATKQRELNVSKK